MNRSMEKITEGWLVYRALTGTSGKPGLAIAPRAAA
jgi:hypothetical protein